ncbi:hypothetical protein Glove_294g62 [Diversispora epigaea]|uniref:Uncharacterized protein n=1 Tax=Diversispora epigaea TaxID=1348612 RepID=A0A397I353_9GLOM|nr:hypothetical protein Glove_294g62 [Diversispora epigaea]
MKTLVNLNERDFIIEVFETTSEYGSMPGYICKCDGIQNELYQTLTVAIYKLRIWIMSVEKSNKSEWNLAGIGYKVTFIYTFRKQRCVFVQEFEEDECTLTIYTGENIKLCSFTNCDSESLWKKVGILQQYNGKLFFGLEEPQIQYFIQILRIPSCTLNDWNDGDLMKSIFVYHLKRRISTCINWQEFFNQWLIGLSTIIELKTQLKKLYPSNHKINAREFRTWKAMLRNVEFWSRSLTPEIDKTNLEILYRQGFLIPIPSYLKNDTKTFWNSF